MPESDPAFAPIDFYHDKLEDVRSRLESAARLNERPIEKVGQPLGKGERTERIGRVLLAVPGLPNDITAITEYTYPSDLRQLAVANNLQEWEKQKRRRALEAGIQANLGGVLIAEFLDAHGYRHQKGYARIDARKRLFHRAIPLAEPAQVGYRKIRGMIVDWQEPVWLYGKTE